MTPKVGDWVRFYQLGQFSIAEIRYIKDAPHQDQIKYCTDQGEYYEKEFLEIRPPHPGSETP